MRRWGWGVMVAAMLAVYLLAPFGARQGITDAAASPAPRGSAENAPKIEEIGGTGSGSAASETDTADAASGKAGTVGDAENTKNAESTGSVENAESTESAQNAESAGDTADGTARPYRAVWVSYLEWQQVDFSSAGAFLDDVDAMLDNIAALGATVVLAQVRPFGDALYPSAYYPFSHLCTGTQGQDPGFDPLALLVRAAHRRGLALEAWVNPYRIQTGGVPVLCADSPAVRHPDWVREANGGLYLDPASAEVRQYIADALAELCDGYDIDGVHLDDYFYPTTDPAFDADAYAATGTDLPLDDWRRQNVNALLRLCRQTVHARGVRLGVAPMGDPEQGRTTQYSDAALWLAQGGYVDYLMPQLYWGLSYSKNGDASHSLGTLAAAWAALPRDESVALYAGLGACRIGDGDGGDDPAEWQSGRALADQLSVLAQAGFAGAGLYRYDSLWNSKYPELTAQERQAVAALWGG